MTISTEPINQETAQVITFLRGIGQGVAAEAKAKLSNPHIAIGLLSDRAAALELALASSMGKHGRQFSDKTLAAVDWEEVAAGLDPQHPRREKAVYDND